MSFAVVETGGKQYKVAAGGVLRIEKLAAEVGEKVVFDKVLLVDDGTKTTVGSPFVKGAVVEAVVRANGRGPKIHIQKYKAKSRYKRRIGHRQGFTEVSIEKVA